ncbi:MAG: hypothetical protein E7455_01020 [Ruminococcaceae bacterium]|nr:hypothetical protein [Oscillospiraceae bacterium]
MSLDNQTYTTNGNGYATDIGTWFMTYNNEQMWKDNFGSGNPIFYRALVSENPDIFGILDSSNVEMIDFQIRKMAEIGIDFILYDITNGGLRPEIVYGRGNEWIVNNAILTCKRIAKWNRENAHKIKYAIAVGMYKAILGEEFDEQGNCIHADWTIGQCTEMQAEAVWKMFVENPEFGGDHYYHLNGKPLLIIHDWGENVLTVPHGWNAYQGDRTYGDRFTVRNGQNGEPGTYGWQTSDGGTQVHPEVEVVCPGWSTASGDSRIPRENGEYYRRNWQVILDNPPPRIVMIIALNDYNESLAIFPTDTSRCNDRNEEQWRNTKGELDAYMYWNITKECINKLRNQ